MEFPQDQPFDQPSDMQPPDKFNPDMDWMAAMEADLNVVEARVTTFLRERGVDFTAADNPDAAWYMSDAYIEVCTNQLASVQVAAEILQGQAVGAATGEVYEETKKRLQIELLAEGFSGPWIELVDREFPGESYDEAADLPQLLERKSHNALTAEGLAAVRERVGDIFGRLFGETSEPLSQKEKMALQALANIYSISYAPGSPAQESPWSDEAQNLLTAYGIEATSRWTRIVEYIGDGITE